jgi:hypothetical protein
LFTTLKIKHAVKNGIVFHLLEAKKYKFCKFRKLGFILANVI